jgi:hypothetical protein
MSNVTPAQVFAQAVSFKLDRDERARSARRGLGPVPYAARPLVVMPGKRFSRIAHTEHGTPRSVHAFVENATGLLIKADGWKAPAKSVTHPSGLAARFDLSTASGFMQAIMRAEFTGGYLYAGR